MAKETLGSLGGDEEEVDETPDKTPQEKKDEAEYSALFGSDTPPPEEEKSEEEPEKEDVFEEPKTPKTVPYERLAKVVGERNEAREKLAQLEGQQAIDAAIKEIVSQHYSNFEDPAAQLRFDATFMEALEATGKLSPSHQKYAAEVMHYIKTKELPTMPDKTTPPETTQRAEEKTPAVDPRVEALLEKETRREIQAQLDELGLKTSFRNVVTDYFVGALEDLSKGFDPGDLVSFTREFIKHNGFDKDDVLATVPKETPKDKPPTGGDRKAAPPKEETPGEEPEKPKGAKDMNEWRKNHEARVKSLLAEL